ncbi:hypothetical protein Adi01nite_72640 [Amorphoplanes digitatis]|uniref:Ig-like domain repeat protein n=2 Tax=Actinoplanes digitatis TaxID=1868 RepID=A0A7W7I6J7_9ACTN|nr:Ig-like domain repeat protein [Actinoplanes digitatis]MBB4767427.1 hypothetical protein [Actinoplanes digitatis]GID97852.1 hypothetical protein Adi01nite_72640 [Actinoplanes digitatis]
MSAGTAMADTYGSLPITSVGDLVVDPVHQRVFISDTLGGKIVATDYRGKVVGELTGLPLVDGLALSADSGRLYAAVPPASALVAVDTATVTEAARYPVGETVHPSEVAAVGDRLWFGYDHVATYIGRGDFGSVDLGTSEVRLHDYTADSSEGLYNDPPRILASPARPGLLVAANMGDTGAEVGFYDISTGDARLTGKYLPGLGTITGVIAFTADGDKLIRADFGSRQSIDVDTRVGTEVFAGHGSTRGLGVATDGRVAVGTDQGIKVYAQSTTEPTQTISLPAVDGYATRPDDLRGGRLAWEPGGDRLFAIAEGRDGFWLLVLNDSSTTLPTKTPPPVPAVALKQPSFSSVRAGTPFTITGTATALPEGAALTVTRVNDEAPAGKVIATVTPDTAGAFGFTDTLTVEGQATYTARYAGTGVGDALTSAGVSVFAAKEPVTLTLSGNGSTYAYGSTVTFTARLGKWGTNRDVEIWADPAGGDQPRRLLKKGAVDSAGKLSVSLRLTRNTALTADYAGDAVYGAVVASATVSTRVAVSTKVTKHYKTKKIGSKTYHVVRTTKDPHFITTMTAYPDRFYRLTIEKYSGGKWKTYKTGSFGLDSKGKSETWITGYYKAGLRFRVRAEYGVSTYSDKVNAKTYGAWSYYTYAK